jgi:hypothetical protein
LDIKGIQQMEVGSCCCQSPNVLKVKMVGKNPKAYGRYMFGMDYLKVVEVD